MTPETKARQVIDEKLTAAGWVVQDMKQVNLGQGPGVAVREYPTDSGPADYLLFVDRQPVGVIEAKRDEAGENITVHEAQTERYACWCRKTPTTNRPACCWSVSAPSASQLVRSVRAKLDASARSRHER